VSEVLLLGWLLGALYVINTWEFPTYLLLAAGALVIAEYTAQGGFTAGGLVRAALSAAGLFLLARPLFLPFWQRYETFYSSVTPWTQDRSRLDHYLIIHGLFVFAIATWAVLAGWPAWRRSGWGRYLAARWRWLGAWRRFGALERAAGLRRRAPATGYLALLGAAAILILGFLARGLALPAFLTALLALVVAASWERRDSPALLLTGLLAATGTALGIFVEFFALQGDIGRMNTVFKFYLQVWVLWGLTAAAALAWTLDRLLVTRGVAPRPATAPAAVREPLLEDVPVSVGAGDGDGVETVAAPRPRPAQPPGGRFSRWRLAWLGAAGALLLAVLAFPLGATPARLADRFNPLPATLDGMAYMPYATLEDTNREVTARHPQGVTLRLGSDAAAIRWLLTNASGSPVVLEASIPEYRWGARVAKYTGLPAVLGWRWHQSQQRGPYAPAVDQRLRDVQIMFDDPTPARTLPLLAKYNVRYVYVGDLERAYYGGDGLAKFERMTDVFRPVYRQDGVTIYEVVGDPGAGTQAGRR
jgi:YYY domain-containing protein